MEKVRIGIVGVGNMGSGHLRTLSSKVPLGKVTAICDIDPAAFEKERVKSLLTDEVTLFHDAQAMFDSGLIDAAIISTPHYFHPSLAMAALKSGLHVLVEKPAGVYTKQVRELNEFAQSIDKKFSMMFNQRTNPAYQKMKQMIENGELGTLTRVNWIITDWYRPQAYYNSGGWRATWSGEGGGVLVNQSPHQLDLLQWLCGMPKRVRAFCYEGKKREIEVENDVTAFMEFENGATGVFITSTCDAPGTNRLEITGERGKLLYENDALTFWRLETPEPEFNAKNTVGFGHPPYWVCQIPTPGENPQHAGILRNWTEAIVKGTPLLAPGQEGIKMVTLANAIHLSSWTDDWCSLPLDEDKYLELLNKKIAGSKGKKNVVELKDVNFSDSFKA